MMKNEKEIKPDLLQIPVSREMKEFALRLSKEKGMSMSQFVRSKIFVRGWKKWLALYRQTQGPITHSDFGGPKDVYVSPGLSQTQH